MLRSLGFALIAITLFASSVLPAFYCQTVHAETESQVSDRKALVVFVFDKSCKISCGVVRPAIQELSSEYNGRVEFVELDVSKDSIDESKKTAKSLGVSSFLSDSEDWYPVVGVFSARKKLVKQILGAKKKEDYKAAIEKALTAK